MSRGETSPEGFPTGGAERAIRDPARPLGRVHLIADLETFGEGEELVQLVRPLLEAGLPSLQLRGKGRSSKELTRAARQLRRAASRAGALFVVNGDLEAALALEADGLHLPSDAPCCREVRLALPPSMAMGRSCHEVGDLKNAEGADWIFLSPVFPSQTKPDAPPLGLERFAELAAFSPAPVYALGGVDARRFGACVRAGAAGVAAIRGMRGEEGLRLLRRARAYRAPR